MHLFESTTIPPPALISDMQQCRPGSPTAWPPRLSVATIPSDSISPLSQPASLRSNSLSPLFDCNNSDSDSSMPHTPSYCKNLRTEDAMKSSWQHHPVYGIIHLTGCDTCNLFMTHMVEAERENSFQLALKDRDRKHDLYFFDGVNEGRRRQRDDDDYLYEERHRYRSQRNEARSDAAQYRAKACESREKIALLQEQLRALQNEYTQLQKSLRVVPSTEAATGKQPSSVEELDTEGMAIYESHPSSDPSSPSTNVELMHNPAIGNVAVSRWGELLQPSDSLHSVAPSAPRSGSSYAAAVALGPVAASAASPSISASVVQKPASLPSKPRLAAPTAPLADLRAIAAHESASSYTPRNPKTVRQLQSLMNAAHRPGNDAALAKVKGLCSEAHNTPREQKTELQRYLLSNWRNPTIIGEPPTFPVRPIPLASKTNPRMDDPVHVWYDYLCSHPSSWPKGVRRDSRNRPFLNDLKASRTVARLRPEIDASRNISSRAEFMNRVVELFSVHGMYEDLIQKKNIDISPVLTFKAYCNPSPVTIDDVVCHFADCGVTIQAVVEQLEPWAQCCLEESSSNSNTSLDPLK